MSSHLAYCIHSVVHKRTAANNEATAWIVQCIEWLVCARVWEANFALLHVSICYIIFQPKDFYDDAAIR